MNWKNRYDLKIKLNVHKESFILIGGKTFSIYTSTLRYPGFYTGYLGVSSSGNNRNSQLFDMLGLNEHQKFDYTSSVYSAHSGGWPVCKAPTEEQVLESLEKLLRKILLDLKKKGIEVHV